MNEWKSEVEAVSVFGLGKLGAPLAATLASKGFRVFGVDINEKLVESINQGLAPFEEPGLQDLIDKVGDAFLATHDYEDAVVNSQASCVIVPTPSAKDGVFILDHVLAAVREIGKAIAQKNSYHLVTVVSTVMPGDTEKVRTALEEVSGKKCGQDLGLCYSPEFIALGRVIHDLLNPDMILIGQSDPRAGDVCESLLLELVDNSPPVMRMNFVNAELTKLAVNTYVTTKITYANMVARICEKMPGADADVVTQASGMDSRIGSRYLKGAVAYGGPCFPRDNIAFAKAAERVNAEAPLAEVTDRFNRKQTSMLIEMIDLHLPSGGTVAVLGLAYKPDTPIVEESASLSLIQGLVETGFDVVTYDPMAMENARRTLNDEVRYASSAGEAIGECDLIVIMTPWKAFRSIGPADIQREKGKVVIIDAWRILDIANLREVAEVIHLGLGPAVHRIAEAVEG